MCTGSVSWERHDEAKVAVVLHSDFPRIGARDLPIRCDYRPVLFVRITPRDGEAVEEDEGPVLRPATLDARLRHFCLTVRLRRQDRTRTLALPCGAVVRRKVAGASAATRQAWHAMCLFNPALP
jgi:hypothetical protein